MRKKRFRIYRILHTFLCTALALCLTAAPLLSAAPLCIAVEASDADKIVRIGYYIDSEAFQYGQDDGSRKSGYAYEYYQEIAKYTGWTYEYVYGGWREIREMLLNGEVDIMAGVAKPENGSPDMLFPDYAMGTETYYIFVPEDSSVSANDFSALNGARIGVKDNSSMQQLLQEFSEDHDIECEIISYQGFTERMQALADGSIDYILTTESDLMTGFRPVFKVGTADFYFAVNKDRPDLLEELNNAQKDILSTSPYFSSRLQDKYFTRSIEGQVLTDTETAWLQEHPELRVGYLIDYMPFCDTDQKTGGLTGILAEILTEFTHYMNVTFTPVGYDDYWEMIAAMENGELDMVFPTFGDLWYAENQHYTQTVTVVSTRMSVIYKDDYQDGLYDRIAVSENSPLQQFYLTMNYPDAVQTLYRNWEECLIAIQNGEVGCMLVNSDLIYRYLNAHDGFSDLHIAENEDIIEFCFAVRRSDSVLYSILNKALNNIDETMITDAVIRNSYVKPKYTLKSFLIDNIALVAAIVGVFILTLIVFFFLYRKRVKQEQKILWETYEKEKKYIAAKEETFKIIGSLSRVYLCTYYVNLTDGVYQPITNLDFKDSDCLSLASAKKKIDKLIRGMVKEPYQEKLLAFLNFETLTKRMRDTDSLYTEYETKRHGWFRGSFISVERNAQGTLTYAIYAIQEINAEKEAQAQAQTAMQDAYEAANRANRAKSDFLARMSHDIRTPMNAIIGMTAIATAHLDDRARVSDCLKKITTSGRHLLTLINEVLDMSKIESGKLELAEEEFNLKELIDSVLSMMQLQIEKKEQKFHYTVKNMEHGDVIGDSLHIRQVFVNIIGNSVKYTPPGGTLKLSVSEKPIDKPRIGCYEFVFEDNGIGMSKEFISRIFEPFSRENESNNNRHVQGTGLGLSIVSNIVKMMGGDIKVESTQGKGSRFTVTIYLRLQDEKSISFEQFVDIPVLVVDDRKESCENTCKILHDIGIKYETAVSGQDAVEKIQAAQNRYFAILLDWKMPGTESAMAVSAIRSTVGDTIPIIVLTDYDWPEMESEAQAAGINTFVTKPLFQSHLTYLFKRLLNNDSDEDSNPLNRISSDTFAGKRVLMAEDNEINAEIAQEIFETAGLTVDHAWNGQEAVNMLLQSEPGYYDIVFMDIQMPVMNGHEASRAIRASERKDLKEIPIIAMTANAFAEDVQASIQAGMNQHIAKPLDIERLVKLLHSWLS